MGMLMNRDKRKKQINGQNKDFEINLEKDIKVEKVSEIVENVEKDKKDKEEKVLKNSIPENTQLKFKK